MRISYVLTTFSPAMFGEKATAHFRIIDHAEASSLVTETTKIAATRVGHERLARSQFPGASAETARYAMLKPDTNAIFMHYRGPQVSDDGVMPIGGMVTFYSVETSEYQDD